MGKILQILLISILCFSSAEASNILFHENLIRFFKKITKENSGLDFSFEDREKLEYLYTNDELIVRLIEYELAADDLSGRVWGYSYNLAEETVIKEFARKQDKIIEKFVNQVNGKSCAVVGSSSNLLESEYGKFIDSHEIVFRMNNAPTSPKYTKHVGLKTNLGFVHSDTSYSKNIPANHDEKFILIKSYNRHIPEWIENYGENLLILRDGKMTKLVEEELDVEIPSTGISAVVVALSLCQSIDLFGFGKDKSGIYGHYYNSKTCNWSMHGMNKQDSFLKSLEEKGLLKMY